MISIPIWLLVILILLAFIGFCLVSIIIYGLIISIFEKDYVYVEEKEKHEINKTTNQQD